MVHDRDPPDTAPAQRACRRRATLPQRPHWRRPSRRVAPRLARPRTHRPCPRSSPPRDRYVPRAACRVSGPLRSMGRPGRWRRVGGGVPPAITRLSRRTRTPAASCTGGASDPSAVTAPVAGSIRMALAVELWPASCPPNTRSARPPVSTTSRDSGAANLHGAAVTTRDAGVRRVGADQQLQDNQSRSCRRLRRAPAVPRPFPGSLERWCQVTVPRRPGCVVRIRLALTQSCDTLRPTHRTATDNLDRNPLRLPEPLLCCPDTTGAHHSQRCPCPRSRIAHTSHTRKSGCDARIRE